MNDIDELKKAIILLNEIIGVADFEKRPIISNLASKASNLVEKVIEKNQN